MKKLLIAFELLYATCTATIKLSVLFFYLRVFCGRFSSTTKYLVKGVMALVFLWSLGNILQVFLICRPFEATYDDKVVGTCANQVASYIAIGAFNVIMDFFVLTLPIPPIWSLQMPRASKISLTIVFMLGFM